MRSWWKRQLLINNQREYRKANKYTFIYFGPSSLTPSKTKKHTCICSFRAWRSNLKVFYKRPKATHTCTRDIYIKRLDTSFQKGWGRESGKSWCVWAWGSWTNKVVWEKFRFIYLIYVIHERCWAKSQQLDLEIAILGPIGSGMFLDRHKDPSKIISTWLSFALHHIMWYMCLN